MGEADYVSTLSRLKAAGLGMFGSVEFGYVSTLSRLKAAGPLGRQPEHRNHSFNTQPPEGGWRHRRHRLRLCRLFQHSAA